MKKNSNFLSFSQNVVWYALLQVTTLLVGLVLPRLFLKVYGSEINGVISTANSFISYFSYIEAGLGASLMYALFKPLALKDTIEINGIVSYSSKEYKRISYIYFALVLVLSAVFPYITRETSLATWEFSLLFFVIGVYGAIDFYTMAKYRVLLLADKKEYVISIAGIVAQLLRFVLVWCALSLEVNVIAVKCLPIFTLAVRTIILKVYVHKKYPYIKFNSEKIIKPAKAVSKRWDAMFMQISINASMTLPAIVISQICGYVSANIFAIYFLVCNAIILMVSSFSSGISPILGQAIAKGEEIAEKYNVYEFFIFAILSTTFSIGGAMILPFIKIYTNVVSDVNYLNPVIAFLILLWGALHSFRIPYTAIIKAAGLYEKVRKLNIVNVLVLFILCIVFTYFWGITGALISLVVVAVHRNLAMLVVLKKNFEMINSGKSVLRSLIMCVLVAVFCFVGTIVWKHIQIESFIMWCVCAIATTLIMIGVMLIVSAILDKPSLMSVLKYLKLKK